MVEPGTGALLGFFVSAATALGKLTSWFVGRDRQERELIASYFDEIAACLREIAERIENDDPPRDTCRRLAVFADELEGILKNRGYVTTAGDVSIDETRLRLVGELSQAQNLWADHRLDPVDVAANDLRIEIANAATHHRWPMGREGEPSEATIDRLESELVDRRRTEPSRGVQPIWDAAGEFAALAATIRVR